MQSKDGPLRVHRMNSKLQNRKLTGQRLKNNEERWRTVMELITETLRKRLGLDFSSFSCFFSLISVKTSYKGCWTPSPQPLTPIYRKMGGGGCTAVRPGELLASSKSNLARPGELVASSLSFLVGPGDGKCPQSDHLAPILSILHTSFRNVTKPYGLHEN